MTHRRPVLSLAALALLGVASCSDSHTSHDTAGPDGSTEASSGSSADVRVVDVTMADIRFETTALAFAAGETVEFRFTNEGEAAHDAFIGNAAAQQQHEVEMAGMATHDHGTPGAVTVAPGATESLTYTFDEAGVLEIGCHQPGHYAAGMKIDVTVG